MQTRAGKPPQGRRSGQHGFVLGLPFKMRFPRSKLYMSVIPPLALGAFIGLLSGIMGVGGGFIMVPALIYLLRVPTSVVFGTSLFQTVFVAGTTTILQATQNRSVDAVLAFLLIIGGVVGAQFGVRAAQRLKAEQLRFLLAALVLAVALRLAYQLVVSPNELFSIAEIRAQLP